MALIVEDGSIVTGANSYNSEDELRDYVVARGGTVSNSSEKIEEIALKAMDFFESFSAQFKGRQVVRDQALSFPRTGLVVDGWSWLSTEIPTQAKEAQCALFLEISEGSDPFNPPVAAQHITSEKVGPISTTYAAPNYISKTVKSSHSLVFISALIRNTGITLRRS